MRPDDIFQLRTVGAPALTPDGTAAIVAVTGPDEQSDEYAGHLWRARLDGSAVTPLTRGHRDTAPDVSRDGRWVAFTRATPGGKPQVHVVEAAGGEPVALTDAPLGASSPRFSPDGARLAYLARVPEEGRYDGDAGAEAPRLVTEYKYRGDGLGFTRDRVQQLFVLDLEEGPDGLRAAGEPRALTAADNDVSGQRWLPSGDALVALLARHEAREDDLRRDAVVVGVDGGEPRPLTDADRGSSLSVDAVLPSQDGSTIWLLAGDMGATGRDFVATLTGVYDVPVDLAGNPSGPARRRTDTETIDLDPAVLAELDGQPVVAPLRAGAVHLSRLTPDDELVDLVTGDVVVSAAAVSGGRIVATVADAITAGDLAVVAGAADPQAPGGTRITDFSAGLRATGRVLTPQALAARAPDGYAVQGWLTTPDPERHGPGPHPTVLMIHGGPFAQYTHAVFDEVQVLVEAGYAVVHGNPRGSSGFGRAHGRAIHRAFGTVDTDDVLALLDAALADERLDATRVGVMGGSYGGYLTAWLTTRTDRFAAAIVERGFLDPVSFVGSSDIGWFFGLDYVGDASDEGQAALVASQSPMAHVGKVTTPTLVIHSEQDWRCPVEQGQRWFVELKRRGVPAELLLFPGEGHELTRSGRPSHRRARFEHVLRWWGRHLPV